MRRRSRFSLLALVLLSFLLGHDALMAADPHQQEPPTHTHAAEIPVVTSCPVPSGIQPTVQELPLPTLVTIAVVMPPLLIPVIECERISWAMPPDTPPDVRRAYLQVFLN